MLLIPKISEIRERRIAAGLSQHSLSLRADLGGPAINRIERGETRNVYHVRAKAIAEALYCKVEDIFTDTRGA